METHYDTLGVQASANRKQITDSLARERKTWRNRQSARDTAKAAEAEAYMALLDEIERVLLNAERRARYDRSITIANGGAWDGISRSYATIELLWPSHLADRTLLYHELGLRQGRALGLDDLWHALHARPDLAQRLGLTGTRMDYRILRSLAASKNLRWRGE